MEKLKNWIKNIMLCLCLAGAAVLCLPTEAKAAEYEKFGETVTGEVVSYNTNNQYRREYELTNNRRYYKIEENGYIIIRMFSEDSLQPYMFVTNGSRIEGGFLGSGSAKYNYMMGVRAGDIICVQFLLTPDLPYVYKVGDSYTYEVSFVQEDYCEQIDEKGSYTTELIDSASDHSVHIYYRDAISTASLTGGSYATTIDTLGVMYKGFLNAYGELEPGKANIVYSYPNFAKTDNLAVDVDYYQVELPKGVEARIYVENLDQLMQKEYVQYGMVNGFTIKVSSPKETWDVLDKMEYDSSTRRHYYAFTTKEMGTYTIRLGGGIFGINASIPYSIGVSYTGAGWYTADGKDYWYENGVKQGTEGRGKEIYDPASDAWYWLDAVQNGAKAVCKDVYQESNGGKWVRYDEKGGMIKGWDNVNGNRYFFDFITGAMYKGFHEISGTNFYFNEMTGILYEGWWSENGTDYWYEGGIRQGLEGRGKEIYDPGSDAWYWLDSIYDGAKAVNKEVYQEYANGEGKWVRYNENGRMVKGWYTNDNGTYYYDLISGAMLKGQSIINGTTYYFDEVSGVLR